ncbi:PPR domain-containing protein/PPR_1 domain-containing protein/PPR_2 domain-containing protein [Cephalotus follicularis]|uniref:PPR domain-containing protein/PPR_1 domain-containing protein/PPR_2 domain-containing protein n=1 Tax=Cephalotus follicularis TaxID=3775 RepID=A0A1Q3CKG3_CEPFO|nr:PPR domain-containing protein/PPR_1 domain-containing protein/PPR_2 domain-containing protein [Cephalotus follicularis]
MVTKLIQMYADCDDLFSAHKLFDKLPHPNVFAWTAVFAFYSRHGMFKECIGNYGCMKFMGVLPDNYVFPKILRACAQLLWLKEGVQVHRDVIVSGFNFSLQVCNSLIDMYAKCGDVRSSRWLFDEMADRDLLSWNSMISGYVCNGMLGLAVELLDSMGVDGFVPDTVTWNTVMDAYCRMGLYVEAWKLFDQIKEPNVITWTTLVSGYSRRGEHEMSLRIFKDMVQSGIVPDLDSLSSVLVSCRYLSTLSSGKEIHGYGIKMETGIAFYSSSGPALLTMYANCGRIWEAKNVFELLDKSDVVTWNAMILGFVDLGLGHLALECFSDMQRRGFKNDDTTISTVLPVCDLTSGKQVHALIWRSHLDSAVSVWNALIHMYSKCGCIGSAYSVFTSMVTRDLVSWNTMIGGFATHGLGEAALGLLREMNRSGICPNSCTFTSALSACSHSGLVDEGLKLFNGMTECFSFNPRMEHFSCVVDMLARAGRLEEAVSFIRRMPIEPEKSIWGALLAACRTHQNADVGKLAAEPLIRLEPERAGHYVTLSNIFARAGRWDDAVEVRKQMEGRGLVKPLGHSWIGSGNRTM